jgi:predicted house-cleaning noncanonical NTP pyrophosphatase (MazG superfamily)
MAARATASWRDRIPDIIRAEGLDPVIRMAGEEYAVRLRDKLHEEVEEFLASDDDPEELADILEVLHALARQIGAGPEQVEQLRAAKEPRPVASPTASSGQETDNPAASDGTPPVALIDGDRL